MGGCSSASARLGVARGFRIALERPPSLGRGESSGWMQITSRLGLVIRLRRGEPVIRCTFPKPRASFHIHPAHPLTPHGLDPFQTELIASFQIRPGPFIAFIPAAAL